MLTHGYDRPNIINLPLRAELKAKAEAPWGGAPNPEGCADASLYRRFCQVGITQVKMFPQMVTHADRPRLQFMQNEILSEFTQGEREEWRAAVAEAEAEGTFFIAVPFHCAVGAKPG